MVSLFWLIGLLCLCLCLCFWLALPLSLYWTAVSVDTCVLEWIAQTWTPPLISVKCRLPPAALVQSSTAHRPSSTTTLLNLRSALSSMLRPLGRNERLLSGGGAGLAVMQDGSVCVSLKWNVIAGFGPIMTLIQLPGLVR